MDERERRIGLNEAVFREANERIQELKNQGGWNDDWKLSHHMVTRAGKDVPFEYVKEHFQKLFLGGLMERERWIARPGTLERLAESFQLAVFTGRPREEAFLSLKRFAPSLAFDPVIATGGPSDHGLSVATSPVGAQGEGDRPREAEPRRLQRRHGVRGEAAMTTDPADAAMA